MKRSILLAIAGLLMLQLMGCGGGGGGGSASDTTPGTTTTTTTPSVPAPVVAGTYEGTYKTNILTSLIPYSLTITQSGSALTGDFASQKISGAVSGTVAADKTMTLTVTEPRSLGSVVVVLTPAASGYTITSVKGTDVFGGHTVGTGTAASVTAPVVPVFANGYNGTGTFINSSDLSTNPVSTPAGTYPVSITNLRPAGGGNYAATLVNKFTVGLLGIQYIPAASAYFGLVYSSPGVLPYILGNGGFTPASMLTNQMLYRGEMASITYITTTSMALHPGDFTKVFPGAWTYTNPDSAAVGILSMQITATSSNGINYSAQATANVRQSVGGPVDTVSGALTGIYNLDPAVNPRAAAGRVFQMALNPSGALTLTNNSGLTTSLTMYVAWVDNGTLPEKALVSVDTGNSTWPDITLGR